MKKTYLTLAASVFAGVVTLTGCSSENNEATPVQESAPPVDVSGEVLEIPETVTGAQWCEDVYVAYRGENVTNPFEVAQALEQVAEQANNEPDAQQAFIDLANIIKTRNPATVDQLPTDEEINKYVEIDNKVNEVFAKYCGGTSIADLFYEESGDPEANVDDSPQGEN